MPAASRREAYLRPGFMFRLSSVITTNICILSWGIVPVKATEQLVMPLGVEVCVRYGGSAELADPNHELRIVCVVVGHHVVAIEVVLGQWHQREVVLAWRNESIHEVSHGHSPLVSFAARRARRI